MEHFGLWGIIPPILTVFLAFATKDVCVSLFLGIFSGALIIAGGNPIAALMHLTDLLASSLADDWNIRIFLFCALLGGLVGLLSHTGATGAFGRWASSKLRTKKSTLLMSFVFGIIVFIDDYFNSLAVGTIMRPVADKHKIPHAKMAYILDSTAAPVCIIAPVSSWVVTVMSIVRSSGGFEKLGMSEFAFFIRAVPYNLYALMSLLFVFVIILSGRDFGPMKKAEQRAAEGKLYDEEKYGYIAGDVGEAANSRAKPFDMLFPICVLIVSAVVFFPVVSWINAVKNGDALSFSEALRVVSVGQAFNDTDSSAALLYAVIVTLAATYIYYLSRRLMNLKSAGEALLGGIKSMVPALIILTMAWAIGALIKTPREDGGLGLGIYLSRIVGESNFPLFMLPAVVFVLSGLISFSTGTSWGTFGIMIPLVLPIAAALAENKALPMHQFMNSMFIAAAAVIGGAVFGDHSSPISDTTILSSTGAGCPHLEHVATQMPYAFFTAVCSFIGFIFAGVFMNIAAAWLAAAAVFAAGFIFLPRINRK
ncbi:MAG: Na+/H+ antiporter NhaC family protein [Treponema brennaborense]|nr:Na+/H+ antiporter NhaC family protein [Treponema brennaborense]